jgi:hypothetical protein
MIFCITLCHIFYTSYAPCRLYLNMLRQSYCELAPPNKDSLFGALHELEPG